MRVHTIGIHLTPSLGTLGDKDILSQTVIRGPDTGLRGRDVFCGRAYLFPFPLNHFQEERLNVGVISDLRKLG